MAFFSGLGAGILAALGSASSGLAASAIVGTAAATGIAGGATMGVKSLVDASKASSALKKSENAQMPQATSTGVPSVSSALDVAKADAKKRRTSMARSKSIYTSPLGVSGMADINQKTLLGQ